MTVHEAQEEILRLKKEKDFCILAHVYQSRDVLEIADYTGDSYGLSIQASKAKNKNVMMCGVRFMAETCKILSPDKNVFLPNPVAGCPMAEQMTPSMLRKMKQEYPDYAAVAYVNTTSELKAECDVCVTSSSAVKICEALPQKKILFIPDPNLGQYVAKKLPNKEFVFFDGGCPRHKSMSVADVQKAKSPHPQALLLVHPECPPEVVNQADFVGSTTEIMSFAKQSEAEEFIIGTEISIVEHLQYECPSKKFYPLSVNLICPEMRATTLMDILGCMNATAGERIELNQDVMTGAKRCIEKMIALGG